MTNPSGSKKSLSSDVTALRKQVSDLKEAAIERRRVEAAVRASEELYRAVVDEAPLAMFRIDPNGKVLVVNPAFIARLGYSSRQDFHTIGDLRGVFRDSEECHRVVKLAFAAGTQTIDIECRRRDGSVTQLPFLIGSPQGSEGVTLILVPSSDLPS